MKFSVNRELLLKPLQQVAGVVERRQTLPVLSNLLLQVSGNQLSMTGTDLEVEMIGRLEVVSPEDGEMTLKAKFTRCVQKNDDAVNLTKAIS